jgi:hypothetical protein
MPPKFYEAFVHFVFLERILKATATARPPAHRALRCVASVAGEAPT